MTFVAAANLVDIGCRRLGSVRPPHASYIWTSRCPLRCFAQGSVTGRVARAADVVLPDDFRVRSREMASVAGFLRARRNQLSVIPKDHASRSRAFPTPRTGVNRDPGCAGPARGLLDDVARSW